MDFIEPKKKGREENGVKGRNKRKNDEKGEKIRQEKEK
jgi:hypothetical protein